MNSNLINYENMKKISKQRSSLNCCLAYFILYDQRSDFRVLVELIYKGMNYGLNYFK